MSNMSYCRFRNTLEDLQDCANWMRELVDPFSELREEELMAAKKLVNLCTQISQDYDI